MQALKNNKDIGKTAPAVVDLLSKSREWLFKTKSTKASKSIPFFCKTTPQTYTCSRHLDTKVQIYPPERNGVNSRTFRSNDYLSISLYNDTRPLDHFIRFLLIFVRFTIHLYFLNESLSPKHFSFSLWCRGSAIARILKHFYINQFYNSFRPYIYF